MQKLIIFVFGILTIFSVVTYSNGSEKQIAETYYTNAEPQLEEDKMLDIQISVNNQTFYAKLYDNETTQALIEQMPMTLDMNELNGNEKYYYFEDSLPTNSQKQSKITTGDLMLYGSDCLVLFYDSLSNSYSYTPLGYIEDTSSLAKALGKGNIEITFNIDTGGE